MSGLRRIGCPRTNTLVGLARLYPPPLKQTSIKMTSDPRFDADEIDFVHIVEEGEVVLDTTAKLYVCQ